MLNLTFEETGSAVLTGREFRVLGTTLTFTVESLGLADEEEIRWYLEDYAQISPFEKSRATAAARILSRVGERIFSTIDWTLASKDFRPHQSVSIQILELVNTDPNSLVRHVFWELLEQLELWPDAIRPSSVVVSRSYQGIGQSVTQHVKRQDTVKIGTGMCRERSEKTDSFNILVCSARPDGVYDIPQRLVSQIVRQEIQRPGLARKARMDIVRPGTFEALKQHFAACEIGYYDIVHFDLHGMQDEHGNSHLAFLQQVPEMQYYICETNLVPAADVADLLEANAVRTVILNACRSARGSSLEASIIGAFLRRGVEHVAAMNYMIVSLSVQIFTACVYRCLMQQGASLASAVHFARKIMKSSTERVSRIGTTVSIDDSVVPLIFEASIAGDKNHGIVECDIQSLADLNFSPTHPFGREDDVRQIEDALLIGRRPLLLTGIAGVGKSSLVQHLRSWWKNTGLIRDFVIVSLDNVETEFCVDAIERKLQLHLLGDLTSKVDHAALVKFLQSHRFLVVIDSLESAEAEDLRLERIKLRSFLKELCGGLTIVIIVSRSKETSLSGETITHELGGLSIMAGLQWIRWIIRASQTILNVPSWDREEDIQYFEQIIKLVDGHPLALQTLVSDFQCKLNKSPKDYFYSDLLGGSHITINRMEYRENRKQRSLREIDALITAWEEISHKGQSFHPVVLSPFWRFFSEREFSQYLRIQCLLQKNAFGSTKGERISNLVQFLEPVLPNVDNPVLRAAFETIKQSGSSIQEDSDNEDLYGMRESAFLVSEDVEIPTLPPQMQSMFDECTSTVLESFSESQFLQPVKRNAVHPALRPKKYLRVHPLLTIMLRAEPIYEQNFMNIRPVCQKALMQYCCWRIKKWPWTYQYWNEKWDLPRAESGLDFMNLAASVQHMIDLGMESATEHAAAYRLVTALQRGAPADSSRIRILMVLWEKLLTVALQDSKRFGGEAAAHPPDHSSSSSSPVTREKPRSDIAAIRVRCSVELAFLLACTLIPLHRHHKSGRADEFLKVLTETHAMIKALPPPTDVPEAEHELTMLGFDNMLAQVTMSIDSRTLDVPEMWKLHEKYLRTSIDYYGVEEYPKNRKTWHDIPLSINSSSEFVARFTSHSRRIRKAIDERRYSDAKSSIGEAILAEINDAGNHAKNLSTLRMYLSEVNEAQGDWQDALDNFEVACRYQDQLREAPMSFEDAMTRELQREFLLQRLK